MVLNQGDCSTRLQLHLLKSKTQPSLDTGFIGGGERDEPVTYHSGVFLSDTVTSQDFRTINNTDSTCVEYVA